MVDCDSLDNPVNGQVDTSNGTIVGSTATYSCNDGFNLTGSAMRTCRQVDTSNETTVGSTATYNCSTGYNIHGNVSLTCGSDGTWSGSPPTCEGKYIFGVIK